MQPSSLMRGTHSVAPRAADTRSCQKGRHKIGRANALDCPGSSAIDGVTLPLLPLYDSDFPRLSILSQLPTSTPLVAAVLEGATFNASIVDLLVDSGRVGGILVLEGGGACCLLPARR